MKIRQKKSGFTLLELMMVVVILAILTTIAVVSYVKYTRRARVMGAVSMLGTIKMKQEIYFTTYSRYACSTSDCTCSSSGFWPVQDPTLGGTDLPVVVKNETCAANEAYPKQGWCALGINPNSDFYFKFMFEGWDGTSTGTVNACSSAPVCQPGASSNCYPLDSTKPWWFAVAHGNLDGDPHQTMSTFFISSSTNTVIKTDELN